MSAKQSKETNRSLDTLNPELSAFDAFEALYVRDAVNLFGLGDLESASFDEFESLLLRNEPELVNEVLRVTAASAHLPASTSEDRLILDDEKRLVERRKQLEKTLVKTSKPQFNTIISFIENDVYEGPLSALVRCVKQRRRIRVAVRRRVGLRSTLTGFLVFFDTHWNLALQDVDEIYYRNRKKPAFFSNTVAHNNRTIQAGIPTVLQYNYSERKGNYDELHRHLKQVFLLGEHVISVNMIS